MVRHQHLAAAHAFRGLHGSRWRQMWFNTSTKEKCKATLCSRSTARTRQFRVTYKMYSGTLNGAVSGQVATLAYRHFDNRADKVYVKLVKYDGAVTKSS